MAMQKPQQQRGRGGKPREASEYDQRVVDLARVTRVTEGGKRMSFRACIVVGNKKGLVGFAIAKGADVQGAIGKAKRRAEKMVMPVPIKNGTIPHAIAAKFKAARILLKPAPTGSGVIAGGAVRIVLEMAGIPNVSGKMLGSSNKLNNVQATMRALQILQQSSWKKRIKSKNA